MKLYVNLNKITKNYQIIKKTTNKEIMAVVKSNAYGLGCNRIINHLKKIGCKWFVFNKLTEYLSIKNQITNRNCLILESLKTDTINKYYDNNLVFSINNLEDGINIKKVNKTKLIRVHFQIDTGMNRIGIKSINEFKQILNSIKESDNIIIEGIYTHFSSGIDEYAYYKKQQEEFYYYITEYQFPIIHTAATSSLHKDIIGNFVRVGMGLYGYHNKYLPLYPVLSGSTTLLKQLELLKGASIGYHQSYKLKEDAVIGIVDGGYYEFHNIEKITINDKVYNFIGEKCMNHSHIYLGDKIYELSRLSLFGKNDIIDTDEYNWYHILTGFDKMFKNYLTGGFYEIPNIFKRTNEKSPRSIARIRSYSIIGLRTIWFKRSKICRKSRK